MTQAKIIVLRTIAFDYLVIRRVPDIFLKNVIFIPTKDALKSHNRSQLLSQKGNIATVTYT